MSKDDHNKNIVKTKYYKICDAQNCEIIGNTPFIIANEYKSTNGVGRYFTVFPNFRTFLKNRNKYPHCHELLVDHVNKTPDLSGRLVFDFDIPKKICIDNQLPKKFEHYIQKTIIRVIDKYMENIDIDIIDFVWSDSKNKIKYSKHLTVKNIYFDNWIECSKIFYKLFCNIWDKETGNFSHNMNNGKKILKSSDIVDQQIVKKNGSLRMVGSKKIDGNKLKFYDKKYKLEDSLIRIYNNKIEQRVQITNFINHEKYIDKNPENDIHVYEIDDKNIVKHNNYNGKTYPNEYYLKAFDIFNKKYPNIFVYRLFDKKLQIDKNILPLNRKIIGKKKISEKCIISGKIHESDGGYLVLETVNCNDYTIIDSESDESEESLEYLPKKCSICINIYFGCYRNCNYVNKNGYKKKLKFIGNMEIIL